MNTRRRLFGLAAGAALLAATLPASAAGAKATAYYSVGMGYNNAYLVDLLPKKKARVVLNRGVGAGTVATDATQKVITLDSPLSVTVEAVDSCDELIQQRNDLQQLVVRDLPGGTAQVVEMGVVVNIGGCQDGLTVPYGTPTDTGIALKRVAMNARPSVADLVPGTAIAGFSEFARLEGELNETEDVAVLQAGSAVFQATGNTVPAAFNADQWLVFGLNGFERAYTRVRVDARTGGETWLRADWAGGQPQSVESRLVVKPLAGAGFGNVAQASRIWESGLFIDSRMPFFFHLYRDGTGERVSKDLDLGSETRLPIHSWGFNGANLVQSRTQGNTQRHRTWVPLRNQGKFRWVMEDEVVVPNGGGPIVLIRPRVNYYEDDGKAVPPTAATASQGMVYLDAKPALPR